MASVEWRTLTRFMGLETNNTRVNLWAWQKGWSHSSTRSKSKSSCKSFDPNESKVIKFVTRGWFSVKVMWFESTLTLLKHEKTNLKRLYKHFKPHFTLQMFSFQPQHLNHCISCYTHTHRHTDLQMKGKRDYSCFTLQQIQQCVLKAFPSGYRLRWLWFSPVCDLSVHTEIKSLHVNAPESWLGQVTLDLLVCKQ